MTEPQDQIPTGSAAAAFIAAGLGCMALGVLTTLSEAAPAVKNFLNWWNPGGPLVGKTGLAVILWLLAWAVLHQMWKRKAVKVGWATAVTLVLCALGILGTFPPFFEAFTAH